MRPFTLRFLSLIIPLLSATLYSFADTAPAPACRLLAEDILATSGQPLQLTLLVPSLTASPLADQATLIWSTGDQRIQSEFNVSAAGAPLTLAGQSYQPITLTGLVPASLRGPTLIELSHPSLHGARILLSLQAPRATERLTEALASAVPPAPTADGTPHSSETHLRTPAQITAATERNYRIQRAVHRSLVPGMAAYDPVYFILGARDGLDARFQISFKYQPFESETLRHLGAAFTTTSLWDLHTESLPFRDSSYRPSFSWFSDDYTLNAPSEHRLALKWQAALWEHESNGRGDTHNFDTTIPSDSRSMNIAFFRPTFTYEFNRRHAFSASLKTYFYYDRSAENRDLNQFRGYADLLLKYRGTLLWDRGDFTFAALLRKGSRGHFTQLDFGIPAGFFLKKSSADNIHGWILIQFLSGYGQTLLDYNRRIPEQLRIGFMPVP